MKTTVVHWFQWFGEAMTHALGSFQRPPSPAPADRHPALPGHSRQACPRLLSTRLLEQICAAEATRFRHGVSIDDGPVVEIGNGARHAQQLKAAARAQAALVDQLFPELECYSLDGSGLPQR